MTILKPADIQETSSIVDVRTPQEFLQEHIPGSRNIPLDQICNYATELSNQSIILSCRSGMRASEAKHQLETLGCQDIGLLDGGLMAWKDAGKLTISLSQGLSVMQQVQITVGSMILIGSFYKPLWFLAPMAGFGLLIAGLTNTCMLALVMATMPWNQSKSSTCSLEN